MAPLAAYPPGASPAPPLGALAPEDTAPTAVAASKHHSPPLLN